MTSRTHRVVLLLILTLAAPAGFSTSPCSSALAQGLIPDAFSGSVRDDLGRSIGQALVLLTPVHQSERVRTVMTDDDGRYRFDRVPKGTYRITAIKQGYAAAMGRVSSWLDERLDLVLASEPGSGPRPHRPSWVVTAPPRDLLREIGASTLLPPPAEAGLDPEERGVFGSGQPDRLDLGRATVAARRFFPDLTGRAEQTFSEALGGEKSRPTIAGGHGMASTLELGSPLGEMAQWKLDGRRESQDTVLDDAAADGRAAISQGLLASFRYETAEIGRLSVRAYYDHDAFRFDRAASGTAAPALEDRERHAWGYDADWRGTVGGDASLQIDLRYAGGTAGARSGRRGESVADRFSEDSGTEPRTSVWRTSARVSKKVGANHSVNIGVKAGIYSLGELQGELIVPSAGQDPSLFTGVGREGWTVSVNAEESWSLALPLALELGVNVSRSMSDSGSLLHAVVPQAGIVFSPDGSTRIRGMMSYVAARASDAYAIDGTVDPTGNPVGYRLRLERTVGDALTLVLDAESRPFFYEFIGGGWGEVALGGRTRAPYVSDASARVSEGGLSVQAKPLRGLVISLGGSAGHVEGRVAPVLVDTEITRVFDDGDLRYTLARIEGRLESTGTDLTVHVMRIDARSASTSSVEHDGGRRMEFGLIQDLAFLRPGDTRWTLLLSYRSDSQDTPPVGVLQAADSSQWTADSRITGGIAVKF